MCGFSLSNIWHPTSDEQLILKAIILQNQSANRKTPQNESEKKIKTLNFLFF